MAATVLKIVKPKIACESCRYQENSRCKRYPPNKPREVMAMGYLSPNQYPVVDNGQWCGEWKER